MEQAQLRRLLWGLAAAIVAGTAILIAGWLLTPQLPNWLGSTGVALAEAFFPAAFVCLWSILVASIAREVRGLELEVSRSVRRGVLGCGTAVVGGIWLLSTGWLMMTLADTALPQREQQVTITDWQQEVTFHSRGSTATLFLVTPAGRYEVLPYALGPRGDIGPCSIRLVALSGRVSEINCD